MKHWLTTISTSWGFRSALLVAATGGLIGCWTLAQAQGETHFQAKEELLAPDQPLITLWTSEESPAQTKSRLPVYVAQKNRLAQVKELPAYRLPAIVAEPEVSGPGVSDTGAETKTFAYGKPLVVDNPFAAREDHLRIDSAQVTPTEPPDPPIHHLPAPVLGRANLGRAKTVVSKTIVPIPAARSKRDPSSEVVSHLPYTSAPLPPNLSGNGISAWNPPTRIDDQPSESFGEEYVANETWRPEIRHGENSRELWWQDGSGREETRRDDSFEDDNFEDGWDELPDTGSAFGNSDITPTDSEATADDTEEIEADWTLAPTIPNTPTVAEISAQVMPAVQKAYGLARHGALYASQAEFIAILRRICHSKDAELGTNEHARSLARGLRALDEADDFMPVGAQLEAEFDTLSIAKSHQTPILQRADRNGRSVLPHDAVAQYHAYAAKEVGIAVAGEQAGSMVLYGLGKIHSHIARRSDQDIQSVRKSMAMYQASLLAHPRNHLAANELGVLLARSGHYSDAAFHFKRVVQLAPGSTAYRNLAEVQRKLGQTHLAAANEQRFLHLAQKERSAGAVSRSLGVEWVSTDQIARVSQPSQMPSARPAIARQFAEGQTSSRQTPRTAFQQPGESRNWPGKRLLHAAKSAVSPGQESNVSPPKTTFWR